VACFWLGPMDKLEPLVLAFLDTATVLPLRVGRFRGMVERVG
jgi:hypothetical protein